MFAIGFQNCFDHAWIDFVFLAGISLISSLPCLYELKSAIIAHLCFSFDDMRFFDNWFEGYPGQFCKCAPTF